jgi:hypothetical protein
MKSIERRIERVEQADGGRYQTIDDLLLISAGVKKDDGRPLSPKLAKFLDDIGKKAGLINKAVKDR